MKSNTQITRTWMIIGLILAISLIPAFMPQWFVSPTGNITIMKIPAFFVILGLIFKWRRTEVVALIIYSFSFLVSLSLISLTPDKGAAFLLIALLHVPLFFLLVKRINFQMQQVS